MARQRRPKGEGSVYESPKGSGRWWARLSKDATGTQPKKRAQSEADAYKVLRQMERDRTQKLSVTRRPLFADHFEAWLTEQESQVKATSHEDYAQVGRRAFVPVFGKQRIDAIERPRVQRWLNEFAETHAANTVKNHLRMLHSIFELAVTDRLIPFNPTKGVKLPKHLVEAQHQRAAAVALTFAQSSRLLTAAEAHRLYALYVVALATGMRQGELLGLRWHNVQLDGDQPSIRVVEQIQLVGNKPVFTTPKSAKSRRDIPIDPDVVATLRDHWHQLQDERQDSDWHEHGLVFPSSVGTPLRRASLMSHFKAVCTQAALPAMRFHDLRHTAGSLMLDSGIELLAVSEILGHGSVNITAQVYAHSYEANKRRAVASVMHGFRQVRGAQ